MADLYFYREILGMSDYLNTVTRRDKIEPNDSLIFNRASGATNQIAYNKFTQNLPTGIESVVAGTNVTVDNTDPKNPIVSSTGGGGGSFANVIDATAGSYSLVPDANSPITVIEMAGGAFPFGTTLTIPDDDFTAGATFVVTNQSTTDEINISLGGDVNLENSSGTDVILPSGNAGNSAVTFVFIRRNEADTFWLAYGDIESS